MQVEAFHQSEVDNRSTPNSNTRPHWWRGSVREIWRTLLRCLCISFHYTLPSMSLNITPSQMPCPWAARSSTSWRKCRFKAPLPFQAHRSIRLSIIYGHIILQIRVYLLHGKRTVFWISLPLLWSRQNNGNGSLICRQSDPRWANLCLKGRGEGVIILRCRNHHG